MYKLSYVVRVSANDLDELKRRCNEVKDFYDDLSVKLVRPFGDMLGLHEEFLPASKRYMNDYIQYVTSDFLAGLGFGATQMLGENEGIYVGYSLDTGRNVYLKPALASQGVKGSVTNALASAFVGSLGGGKSFANNLIVYYAVLYGAQAVIVDPKAERGRWKETLPEISHEINIVTLTSDEKNKGLLDPYVIMKNPKDSESLAIDILTFLTGISSRDGERFPILRKAIRAVTNSEVRGLMKVIEELRVENTPLSTSIADHIESFTDYDFAHLLFSNGYVEQSISLEKQLNIIQVADLVLPDKETSFEEYTTMELLSVAMLIVISTFALDFIHTDRSIFKIVDLDEAWSFLQVAQGKTLSMKLVRVYYKVNPHKKVVIALWVLLGLSFSFAIFKHFTAIDTHTIHETTIIEKEYVDTHHVENFVENFAKVYYSWEQSDKSIDNRMESLKGYLTDELQALNVDTVRKDIPVSSSVRGFQIWTVEPTGDNEFNVTYSVDQLITEGENTKTVHSAYIVSVYVDGSGNMVLVKNPTITNIPKKSSYKPKAIESEGTVDSITTNEINEFLTTFFKLYPTATASELSYYVNDGILKPIGKEYIFQELVNPIHNRKDNQVTVSLTVEYIDQQTKATQVSQFDLVLEKNGSNWKIIE